MNRLRLAWLVPVLLSTSIGAARQEPAPATPPLFRGGTNLVRVDAYVSRDGVPVTDLEAADFEVLEDDVPQRVEDVRIVNGAVPGPDDRPRLFVIFFDVWHAPLAGTDGGAQPAIAFLDTVVGADDMVGFMTPEVSARNLSFGPKARAMAGLTRNDWLWRGQSELAPDAREAALSACYPDAGDTAGLARELVARRRERRTIEALGELVSELERTRRERTYVVVLSTGWPLFESDEALAASTMETHERGPRRAGGETEAPHDEAIPAGTTDTRTLETCGRERAILAFSDDALAFRQLLQRANRANVSFYPIDAGQLGAKTADRATDAADGADVSPAADAPALHASLEEMARQTDGTALVDKAQTDEAARRIEADAGTYYMLSYYSSNPRLDGRYRRLAVRVDAPGVEVRTRMGYLAPTEADMASARVDALVNGAPPGHSTALEGAAAIAAALGRTPVRSAGLRLDAVGGPGRLWLTLELDRTISRTTAWQAGGTGRLIVENANGDINPLSTELTLDAGQRTVSIVRPDGPPLTPGRYVVRVQLTPAGEGTPVMATVAAIVPDATAMLGGPIASRRGPSTGLAYERTADARYRRTERLRLEIPRMAEDATVSAVLLNSQATLLPLDVTLTDRFDEALGLHFSIADLTLAPLAQARYVLRVIAESGGRRQTVDYSFEIVS